jgi:hypothetical protein
LLNKKLYYPILLTILLCISIDISSYNYIALGKEDNSDDNVREKEKEEDNNRDNDVREEKEEDNNRDNDVREEKEEKDEVPFILPFKAVPFP